jgi:hypothetical protein
MTPPPQVELPGWTEWSTRESIEAETLSLTAIVETLIAVPLYWWLAIHFETYGFLLLGAASAVLVLLRSDASVALGKRWFTRWEQKFGKDDRDKFESLSQISHKLQSRVALARAALKTATGFAVAYLLAWLFLPEVKDWWVFFGSIVISWVAVAIAAAAVVSISMMIAAVDVIWMKLAGSTVTTGTTIVWRGVDVSTAVGSKLPEAVGTILGIIAAGGTTAGLLVPAGAAVGAAIAASAAPRVKAAAGGAALAQVMALAIVLVAAAIRAVQFSCFRPRAAVGPRPKPGKARRSFTPKLDLSGLKRSTRILR